MVIPYRVLRLSLTRGYGPEDMLRQEENVVMYVHTSPVNPAAGTKVEWLTK